MGPLRRVAAAALLLAALLPASCAAGPSEGRVLLFHTNDIHGHIERLPTLAGLVKAERERRRDVLWLDAGDHVSGTPVSTVFQGTPVFSVTSLAGVDASCLGNHEFDHGWERIAKFREAATFPLLCANARSPEGELIADAEWTVFPVGPVRVGVIGLVTEKTPSMTIRKGNEGVRFEPAREALERLVPVVRPKCDLLVALTHVGYDEDLELARSVKGVDVIVGGHSHTDLPGPVQVGDTVVVQAGCYAMRLGRLELVVDLDRRRVAKWEGRPVVVEPDSQPRDPVVAGAVAELEKKVAATVDVVVGRAARDLDRDALRDLAERAFRETLGADLGLQNDGGVRSVVRKGPVTVRALWETFPFDNTLVKVRVRGARLPERLAKRIGTVDPDRIYTVATNSFVVDHLDKYVPGAEPDPEDTGLPARDAVVDWVRKHPELK
jgi:2',3'-cyclic-nucleotide 2'-phosphodiesterase (5'-nucleotidase family)